MSRQESQTSGRKRIVGIGELLWDLLPDDNQLGGAPANFAYHAAQLGNDSLILSRIGNDDLGDEARNELRKSQLSIDYIQIDEQHPTGTIDVHIDSQGQPTFIVNEGAWDWLEFTPEWRELAANVDAVCFGSLAQRSEQSRNTIHQFLQATPSKTLKIFDVNLRQSFFSRDILEASLRFADIVKINDEELPQVCALLGFGRREERWNARQLLGTFNLKLVCVTRGARGSLLIEREEEFEHPGFPVTVCDTVGAGDSFTAALVHHYLRSASLARISEAANLLGSWVATQAGAMPKIDGNLLNDIA